jgi:hypothetical protein
MPDRLTKKDIKKAKKPVRSLQEQELYKKPVRSLQEQDPYLARPELQEGFYDQPKPPISYETLMGTEAKLAPNVTDTEAFKKGGKIKTKKAFLGLAVKALPQSLIGVGADKLLQNSQTARDISKNLGIGGKMLSDYYDNKKSNQVEQKTAKLKTGGGATKPGLYANINRRKRLGISRPKSESTVSKESFSNMKKGFPKKQTGGFVTAGGNRLARSKPTKLC